MRRLNRTWPAGIVAGYVVTLFAVTAIASAIASDQLTTALLVPTLLATFVFGFLYRRMSAVAVPMVLCAVLLLIWVADSSSSELSGTEHLIVAVSLFLVLATITVAGVFAARWAEGRRRRH